MKDISHNINNNIVRIKIFIVNILFILFYFYLILPSIINFISYIKYQRVNSIKILSL